MAGEALTTVQAREVNQIAEIKVRKYFDYYLGTIQPQQEARMRQHVVATVNGHNLHPDSHGGVQQKVSRFIWIIIGVAIASGGSGVAVAKLLSGLE